MSDLIPILVVEDSPIVCKIIRHVLKQFPNVEADFAYSLADAQKLVSDKSTTYFAAIADLNLPDAPNGELVDYLMEHRLPSVVLTGTMDDERRDQLFNKGVVDYVTKEGKYSYQYAVNLITRLYQNQSIKILVVDDSETQRKFIRALLERHCFQVYDAKDGMDAIKCVVENPDIRVLISDYNMPRMDGFELVQNLRNKYEKSDMIIIGLSAEGQPGLSAKFIKNGANDFLRKPFNQEEFYCRVMHNVEMLDLVEQIRDSARRDYLTGCYNRRHFYEQAEPAFDLAFNGDTQLPLSVAVIDIDHFKSYNDNFGHDAGDAILVQFSKLLERSLERFLVARAGGEEFFVLMPGLDNDRAYTVIDRVRELVEREEMIYDDHVHNVTFSAGVSSIGTSTLDEMISLADQSLYRAKEAGRNLVIGDDLEEE